MTYSMGNSIKSEKYLSELSLLRILSLGGKCLGYSILAPTSSHKEKNNEKKNIHYYRSDNCDINVL